MANRAAEGRSKIFTHLWYAKEFREVLGEEIYRRAQAHEDAAQGSCSPRCCARALRGRSTALWQSRPMDDPRLWLPLAGAPHSTMTAFSLGLPARLQRPSSASPTAGPGRRDRHQSRRRDRADRPCRSAVCTAVGRIGRVAPDVEASWPVTHPADVPELGTAIFFLAGIIAIHRVVPAELARLILIPLVADVPRPWMIVVDARCRCEHERSRDHPPPQCETIPKVSVVAHGRTSITTLSRARRGPSPRVHPVPMGASRARLAAWGVRAAAYASPAR